jgi:hypothetical protein
MRPSADAEAKLMLASVVTVLSNGFVFQKTCVARSFLTGPSHNDMLCAPIVDCQEQQQQRCLIGQSPILAVNLVEQCHQKNCCVFNH